MMFYNMRLTYVKYRFIKHSPVAFQKYTVCCLKKLKNQTLAQFSMFTCRESDLNKSGLVYTEYLHFLILVHFVVYQLTFNLPSRFVPRERLSNGSLYFPPFSLNDFRSEIHQTVYKCILSNVIGSIVSRECKVRAGKQYQSVNTFTTPKAISVSYST